MKIILAVTLILFGPSILWTQTLTSIISEEVRQRTSNLPFSMPALDVPHFPDNRVSITAFGAVGDGRTMNTKAFADAFAYCVQKGGGVVDVPPGLWLTGPIKLESNVDLNVERGALIQFSKRIEDYPLIAGFDGKSKRYIVSPPIYAYKAKNVGISGEGVVDGGGEAWRYVKKEKLTAGQWKELTASGGVTSLDGKEWWPSKESLDGEQYLKELEASGRPATIDDYAKVREYIRPDLVQLVQCNGILLDETTFQNSPRFHVRPAQSENIIIRNIKIRAPWYGQNTDGLDPTSCRNMIIYGITVDVGDDGICLKPATKAKSQKNGPACENIVITDCLVYQAHGGFVIGSESYGGVNNVYVHNCTFIGTDVGLRFKSLRGRGGLVENVFVDGIRMRSIQTDAILFDMYYGGGSPDVEAEKSDDIQRSEAVTERTPRFQGFSIRNIECIGARSAVVIKGLGEMPIKNLLFENISIQSERGISISQADGIVMRDLFLAPKIGPVLSFNQTRNITIDTMEYPKGLDCFLKVAGDKSRLIELNNVDLAAVKKGVELSAGVNPDAVIIKK